MVRIPTLIPLNRIRLHPGSTIAITGLSWEQFETILEELGERRGIRFAFFGGTLELMSPLPAHERPHRFIADVVKAILDEQNRDWEDFGSTTFSRRQAVAGLEPDTCFYIQNAERVRDCQRMDLDLYPPPDLAIEVDLTSRTALDAYRALGVPEVWIYSRGKLQIHLLGSDGYLDAARSAVFPDLPMVEWLPGLVERALQEGGSRILREVRLRLGASGGHAF